MVSLPQSTLTVTETLEKEMKNLFFKILVAVAIAMVAPKKSVAQQHLINGLQAIKSSVYHNDTYILNGGVIMRVDQDFDTVWTVSISQGYSFRSFDIDTITGVMVVAVNSVTAWNVIGFDIQNGQILWDAPFAGYFNQNHITVKGDMAYIVGISGPSVTGHEMVVSFDLNTKSIAWAKEFQGSTPGTAPQAIKVIVDDFFVFVFSKSADFVLHAHVAKFDMMGNMIQQKSLTSGGEWITDVATDGTYFYVLCRTGPIGLIIKVDKFLSVVAYRDIAPNGADHIQPRNVAVDEGRIYIGGWIQSPAFLSGTAAFVIALDKGTIQPVWGRIVSEGQRVLAMDITPNELRAYGAVNTPISTVVTRLSKVTGDASPMDCYTGFYLNPVTSVYWGQEGVLAMVLLDIPTTITASSLVFIPPFVSTQVCASTPMSAELLLIEASVVDQHTNVRWQTASENASDHFRVLRSSDMDSWQEVGTVPAAGHSQSLREYSFVDESPSQGWNYYKLIEVDELGFEADLGMVSVWFEASAYLLYPNPARAGEVINLGSPALELTVQDELGRNVPFSRPDQASLVIERAGVYFVSIISESSRSVHKVIIH